MAKFMRHTCQVINSATDAPLLKVCAYRYTDRWRAQRRPLSVESETPPSPENKIPSAASASVVDDEDRVLKESIRSAVESNPALVGSFAKGYTVSPPADRSPELSSTEYGKVKLSQDNIMVDTYAFVKALRSQGFTTEQAECVTYTFTQLMNDALKEQRKLCVEKSALDVMREQMMAHIAALRKDMTILEKSELSDLRNENDKLKLLLSQAKSQIAEDISKVKNQLTLDINIERARAKEDFVNSDKSIALLSNRMTAGLGNLETTFERYKNDIYKVVAGTVASALTIGLGIYRIMKS